MRYKLLAGHYLTLWADRGKTFCCLVLQQLPCLATHEHARLPLYLHKEQVLRGDLASRDALLLFEVPLGLIDF
jgi:hypothetical protein